ncbi:hypothetical protein WDW86_18600 [Bdellovibrionota bacterium FG-2]
MRWPGFYVSFPAGVIHSGPYDKAQVLSCDGKSLDELFASHTLPYYGVPSLESSLFQWGPRTFLDFELPWQSPIKTCLIQKEGESAPIGDRYYSLQIS